MEDARPKLTLKQQRFVDAYLQHGNASRAAREAGYSEKTAFRTGQENLHKPAIKAILEQKAKESAEKAGLTREWIVERLMAIADTHVQEIVEILPDGGWRLKNAEEVDRLKLLALEGFKESEIEQKDFSKIQRELKMTPKTKALELLGNYLGGTWMAGDEQSDAERDREDGASQLPRVMEFFKRKRKSK